ncbi:putative C-type lectin protein [Bufonid herpesvirus 1]|uniref:putative C-type lectin protein n=1 Tax=Bufonid herpesvirus 1 TaxID=2282206 RepID=UPI000EB69BF7|nr:putative C-type lectin protein [Bufonid herpesvirus 1]AXF48506.1 putative C-type lectin protein [Bufonid herpesvirus 1]
MDVYFKKVAKDEPSVIYKKSRIQKRTVKNRRLKCVLAVLVILLCAALGLVLYLFLRPVVATASDKSTTNKQEQVEDNTNSHDDDDDNNIEQERQEMLKAEDALSGLEKEVTVDESYEKQDPDTQDLTETIKNPADEPETYAYDLHLDIFQPFRDFRRASALKVKCLYLIYDVCYYLSPTADTFSKSRAYCQNNYGDIAVASNTNDLAILVTLKPFFDTPYWLGLVGSKTGTCTWLDKNPFNVAGNCQEGLAMFAQHNQVSFAPMGSTKKVLCQVTRHQEDTR